MEDSEWVAQALAGEPDAVRRLIHRVTPIIQARVARVLARAGNGRDRDVRQEFDDFVQEVFLALFNGEGRALKAWKRERGLSFLNFIGLLAEREAVSILRNGRRNPFTEAPVSLEQLDCVSIPSKGHASDVECKDLLLALLAQLRTELSPKGLHLFELLLLEECSIEEASRETGLEPGALYTWKSRLRRQAHAVAARLSTPARRAA